MNSQTDVGPSVYNDFACRCGIGGTVALQLAGVKQSSSQDQLG